MPTGRIIPIRSHDIYFYEVTRVIFVNRSLKSRQKVDNLVFAALAGAGFIARGVALQFNLSVPAKKLVAIADRHIDGAVRAWYSSCTMP